MPPAGNESAFQARQHPSADLPQGHVYTLHAELEGMKLLPVMEQLLKSWREAGDDLVSTETIYKSLDRTKLPRKQVVMGEVPGRSGLLALEEGCQGTNGDQP